MASDVVPGEDGKQRCRWGDGDDRYRDYHDTEWGRPVLDERGLYERLCLECLQSGLSWALILRKRDGIRDAFAGFDPDVVGGFGPEEIAGLLEDARVIRNRRKLEARRPMMSKPSATSGLVAASSRPSSMSFLWAPVMVMMGERELLISCERTRKRRCQACRSSLRSAPPR